jgi:general nucleoside transport system ATP-binding protein
MSRITGDLDTDRVLTARSVSKSFGSVRALRDVDIDVRPGRVHAIVGENGAGKSTLAKILAGIEQADAATMAFAGDAYRPRDRAEARRRGVNMVPQQLSLVGELSLVENMLLVGSSPFARRSRARAALAETLARADVAVDLDVPTARLSQAHRQLGEIVTALAEGARVLILDEPTASLGPLEVGGLFAHLKSLCRLGTAIILITHRLDEVREVADDVTVLSHGEDVHHGPAAGLEPRRIAQLMVGDLPEPAPRAPRAPGDVVIELDAVSATSAHHAPIHDVTLAVRAGEVVGVAGVAGSGQNALIDVVAGFERPVSGTVRVGGVSGGARGMLGAGVAWMPEERAEALAPNLAAGENLGVYAHATGARRPRESRAARRERQTAEMRAFDVRPAQPGLAAGGLSGGNQQKLLVARELGPGGAGDGAPAAILAYGPTQGLDLRASQAIRERLVAAAERGAAVLVASHDLEEILAVADRVVVMFAGRVVADLPVVAASTEVLGAAMAGIGSDA